MTLLGLRFERFEAQELRLGGLCGFCLGQNAFERTMLVDSFIVSSLDDFTHRMLITPYEMPTQRIGIQLT